MQRARRKQFNTINAPALARGLVITGFLAVTGLVYVYLTVQLYHLGDQKKTLENELTAVRSENDVVRNQIATLTSHVALQRRLKEGQLKLVPIAKEKIERLSLPPTSPVEIAVQPVANQRTEK